MTTKLTLTVEKSIIERAKVYAKNTGRSLSEIIEKYLETITEELDLIKNYLLGQLLKSADGPYSMTDLYMSAEAQGLNFDFYNKAIKDLHAITPERIRELAVKYLVWDEMTIVSAG